MINYKDVSKVKFEEALTRIEEIVVKLEEGKIPLEDTLSFYEEGILLIHACEEKLNNAKLKIEEIDNRDYSVLLKPSVAPKRKRKETDNDDSKENNVKDGANLFPITENNGDDANKLDSGPISEEELT